MLQFDSLGLLGLVAVVMCWGLAAVLYRVESTSGVARMLALLLVIEGVTLVSTGYVRRYVFDGNGPCASCVSDVAAR